MILSLLCDRTLRNKDDDDVELNVLGCRVDILGTNCEQCVSMVQCCFTSTETVRLIRTESPGRPPRLSHSSWTLREKQSTLIMPSAVTIERSETKHCDNANTKRFKRTLIYFNTDTQYANFRGNPFCQTTKRHLNNRETVKNDEKLKEKNKPILFWLSFCRLLV